ncbi:uncharacterized protein DDB_G0284459-like isoform X3 [Physella acuta]|uniref:uncharacterized protein DDB_G0284459-like isoform X3 n=1 Tax=Physella acuta TaxID=109671 RepID=UPI0027DE8141|nr:uncharacterized protein DDB_G0284459-like isoform X3 [Physella acuta]
MATIGDDCYFFCTSSCAKGAACPFRHVESAKTAKIICQHWEMGGCMRPMCKFRHSNFKLQVDSTEVPCYWESQPVGCTKPNCLYKHSKPRSQISPAAPVTNTVPSSTATEPSVTTPITSSTTQNIVPPLVKPVVIQPATESDESNTSPVKLAIGQGSGQVPTKESVPNPEDNQKTTNQENTKQETKAVKVNVKDKSTKPKMKVKKVKVNPGKKLVKAKEDMLGVKAKQLGKKMKNPNVQKKSVRERLGAAPVQTAEPPAVESSESESDSDSDDSIENIKVMSMEEIFRQKALESMLKKRAENNTQTSQLATTPSSVIVEKKTPPVAALAESSSATTTSSSSSEEEEEETSDEKETTMKASSDSDSSSSSSDSEEEEEDDDDEFEPDVRRVIVQEENEKVARKRAHASLQKKQISVHPPVTKGKKMSNARVPVRQNAAVSSKQAVLKKRKVNVDYDSDDIVSCRVKEPLVLNVRDRLGNSLNNKKAVSASVQSRSERLELSSGIPKREANSPHKSKIVKVSKGNSDEEQNPLADIKIKTLEEIRQEKMRKLASQQRLENKQQSTVKQRLGLKQNDSDTKGRQILIISGSKSDDADNAGITEEQKKAKKRPWRTQKRGVDQVNIGDGGDGGRTTLLKQRQVSADGDMPEEEQSIEESPFERLRRKALIKKKKTIEAKRLKLHASVNEEHDLRIQASPKRQVLQDFEDLAGDNDEAVEEEVVNSSNKKHKHRHKHKQDRKSKTERQIYVPPAMKSSALKEEDVTMKEAVVAPTAKVAPQKRGPHPIAAAWAAGLTLSAKGTQGKRPAVEVMPISERLGTNEKIRVVSRLNIKENSPEKKCTKIQTNEQIEQPTEVTIKSFSEIMAEKRRKRLEMQAQKSGANASTGLVPSDSLPASSVSLSSMSSTSSPSKNIANKPRVPITPIVFNTDTAMSSDRLQPTVDPPLTAPPKPVPQQPDAPVFSSKSHPAITHNRESQQRVKLKSFNSAHVKNNKVKLFTKRKSIEHSDTNISEDSDLSNSSNSTPSSYSVKTETSLTKPATHQKGASSNASSSHSHNPMSTPKNHGNTHSHLPSTSAVSLVSPYEKEPDTAASVYKQPVPTETEPVKKSRPSFEDEFSFFDDVGLDDDNVISGDVEPIDDLLQDIDDLLA